MTPELEAWKDFAKDMVKVVAAGLAIGAGALGVHRRRRPPVSIAVPPERYATKSEVQAMREEVAQRGERLTRLETRHEDLVRRMEERDDRAERERAELLAAINSMGERLEGKIDGLVARVYGQGRA